VSMYNATTKSTLYLRGTALYCPESGLSTPHLVLCSRGDCRAGVLSGGAGSPVDVLYFVLLSSSISTLPSCTKAIEGPCATLLRYDHYTRDLRDDARFSARAPKASSLPYLQSSYLRSVKARASSDCSRLRIPYGGQDARRGRALRSTTKVCRRWVAGRLGTRGRGTAAKRWALRAPLVVRNRLRD
jgi:hypothetical protein